MAKDINKKDKKVEAKAKKTRKKVNPFDVIIVMLILCLIGSLAYRVYDGVSVEKADENSKYVIEFICDDAYNSTVNYLGNKTQIYLPGGELLGDIYTESGRDAISVIVATEAVTEEVTEVCATCDTYYS